MMMLMMLKTALETHRMLQVIAIESIIQLTLIFLGLLKESLKLCDFSFCCYCSSRINWIYPGISQKHYSGQYLISHLRQYYHHLIRLIEEVMDSMHIHRVEDFIILAVICHLDIIIIAYFQYFKILKLYIAVDFVKIKTHSCNLSKLN